MIPDHCQKLAAALEQNQIKVALIPPGGDMNFLIGFDPGGCERFQALFVTADKRLFCVTNKLYAEDMTRALPPQTPVYTWEDSGHFSTAVTRAFADHQLGAGKIGINQNLRAVDYLELSQIFPDFTLVNADPQLSAIRIIKTQAQIAAMERAGSHADAVMDHLKDFIRPGLKEREIRDEILGQFAQRGLSPSFNPIVASGSNNSRPHYNGDQRTLTEKDVIILDFGCKVDGFCSDTSRTFFLGEPSPRESEIFTIVTQAFQAAAETAAQGVEAGAVDQAARDVITRAGFGEYFINRVGHGIGMDVHEEPYIKGNSRQILEPGMAFSIEPGIYIPGEVGMRVEDIFVINAQGKAQSLNHSDRGPIIL
ncbi:MAG: Xaa-Pro peptidase family protein [Desulfobacterales bacterium]|nr:Xaa-Pro peptidase family protein [Desulfobacterales bacterium]